MGDITRHGEKAYVLQCVTKDKITLSYDIGDPVKYEELERVVSARGYRKCIILSSERASQAALHKRDSRVLSIMLNLRHIQRTLNQKAMQIIAENSLYYTPMISTPP